ncbi:hypothetical protein E4U58_001177 [Claviceps cyperi]|nr:hypothetical protein E4U58_001177 [Claviceps cyperi]
MAVRAWSQFGKPHRPPSSTGKAASLGTVDVLSPITHTGRVSSADIPGMGCRHARHNNNRFKVLSRLHRTFNLTERIPCSDILPPAPRPPDPTKGLSKEDAAAALQENPPDVDAVVFSDGSKDSGDDAGFGSEVYDGEVWGALAGLQASLRLSPPPLDIDVLLDNTAAIRSVTGLAYVSSQAQALEFARLAREHGDVSVT